MLTYDSDGRPKKPLSTYFKFKATLIADLKEKGATTVNNAVVKERWDNMSEAQKQKLTDEYNKEMDLYKVEIEKYEQVHGKKPKRERKREASSSDEKPAKSKGRGRKEDAERAKSKNAKEEEKPRKDKSLKKEKAEEQPNKKAANKKK